MSADPARSAVILAQDRLPDPLEQSRNNRKVYDGRLTVETIERWRVVAVRLVDIVPVGTGQLALEPIEIGLR